jgi:hypothetical protein
MPVGYVQYCCLRSSPCLTNASFCGKNVTTAISPGSRRFRPDAKVLSYVASGSTAAPEWYLTDRRGGLPRESMDG